MPWLCLTKRTFKRSFCPPVERNDKMNGNFRLRRCHRSCGISPIAPGSKSFWTWSVHVGQDERVLERPRRAIRKVAPASSNLATVSLTLFRWIRRGFGAECMPGTLQPISSLVPFTNRLRCLPFSMLGSAFGPRESGGQVPT